MIIQYSDSTGTATVRLICNFIVIEKITCLVLAELYLNFQGFISERWSYLQYYNYIFDTWNYENLGFPW